MEKTRGIGKKTIEELGLEEGPRSFFIYELSEGTGDPSFTYYTNLKAAKHDEKRLRARKERQGFRTVEGGWMEKRIPGYHRERGGGWAEGSIDRYVTEVKQEIMILHNNPEDPQDKLHFKGGKLLFGFSREVYSKPRFS
jgi:hypothetical protein